MKVIMVVQSPMNKRRWELTLQCYCTKWVTSDRRPRITAVRGVTHRPDCLQREHLELGKLE